MSFFVNSSVPELLEELKQQFSDLEPFRREGIYGGIVCVWFNGEGETY